MNTVPNRLATNLTTLSILAAVGLASSNAHAQWTATLLHPEFADASEASAIFNGTQVGWAQIEGAPHAAMWTGTPASHVDLNPIGAFESRLHALDGAHQVGYAIHADGQRRPAIWSGTVQSWQDLTPAGAVRGELFAVHGAQQAGVISTTIVSAQPIPSLWAGTPGSWESRLAPDTTFGTVFGVRDDRQVGWCGRLGSRFAMLWNGDTAVPLTSTELFGDSAATATHGDQQVGYFQFAGPNEFACLWTGTLESRVSLHPPFPLTDTDSRAYAVHDGYQVGYIARGSAATTARAVLWRGTAESKEELSGALPPGFTTSVARGVWNDGTTLYVVGYAGTDAVGSLDHRAILWTRPILCPSEWDNNGGVNSSDISAFLASWLAGVQGATLDGDFNHDEAVNSNDISGFLTAWLSDVTGGC